MPILIRRGGQYVRYNGKYATDIDLCDCTCDDYPPAGPCKLFGLNAIVATPSSSCFNVVTLKLVDVQESDNYIQYGWSSVLENACDGQPWQRIPLLLWCTAVKTEAGVWGEAWSMELSGCNITTALDWWTAIGPGHAEATFTVVDDYCPCCQHESVTWTLVTSTL